MPVNFRKIDDIFREKGLLARSLPEFEFRNSQPRMARLIEKAINKKTQVIIEAGTGVGKTMGYLIPILMSGKKSVISTGTKNLQEQVFFKDIPLIAGSMGINVSSPNEDEKISDSVMESMQKQLTMSPKDILESINNKDHQESIRKIKEIMED